MPVKSTFKYICIIFYFFATSLSCYANNSNELALRLANPLAHMVSIPLQNNFDLRSGVNKNGSIYTLNIEPVIPFTLNDKWNLINRTIFTLGYEKNNSEKSISGLGDTTTSLFLSPVSSSGFTWGAGPVFLLPTATNSALGGGKFGIGPTAVALVQHESWTFGTLTNHIWSISGAGDKQNISQSLLQPFLSYNFGHGISLSGSIDSNYNWIQDQWTVPLNLGISRIVKLGNQAASVQLGGRYYFKTPEFGPQWGLRTTLTLLFPK